MSDGSMITDKVSWHLNKPSGGSSEALSLYYKVSQATTFYESINEKRNMTLT